MDFLQQVQAARTCRRYDESAPLSAATLSWLVDCARQTSSAGNKQVLRYVTVAGKSIRDKVFPALRWAGALPQWGGPVEGERPTGYILILAEAGKKDSNTCIDLGIAGQTIQLAAHSKGIGACMFLSFNPKDVAGAVDLPSAYEVILLIALGMEKEVRKIVPVPASGEMKYFRDEAQVHCVPKRALKDVLLIEQ